MRRIASDALMSLRFIEFDGSCAEFADAVLESAEKQGKLLDLVRVAHLEYPTIDAVKVAKAVLESGGRLRPLRAIPDDRQDDGMPLDARDQAELNRLRDAQHKLREDWQLFVLQSEKRWLILENWKEEIEEEIEGLRTTLTLVRGGAPLVIPARYVRITLIAVFLFILLIFLYILMHPGVFSVIPIPSGPE